MARQRKAALHVECVRIALGGRVQAQRVWVLALVVAVAFAGVERQRGHGQFRPLPVPVGSTPYSYLHGSSQRDTTTDTYEHVLPGYDPSLVLR